MSTIESTSLHLERTFDAPADAVFDAWTNPELLRRWWAPRPGARTVVAEVDLRVGGAYRLSMEDPDSGERNTVGGEYREVRRPERLVYSWAWEQGGPEVGHTSTVTVEFRDEGGRTTVVVDHVGLQSPVSRERHEAGWAGCMASVQAGMLAAASGAA